MELPLAETLANSLRITIWFLSVKPDGVLMFATQSPGGEGDFISLNLVNKKLVFTFFLGSGLGVIESKKHIHLDKWHEVTINRTGKMGQMTIDDHPPVTGEAKGSSSLLNMEKRPLFLGGFRSADDLPPRAAIKTGFTGAIQKVIVNGRTIDGLMSRALTMRNISTYNGPPCKVNPCMNGGVCVPALNLADCRCPSNFMGKHCEKRFEQMDLDQPIQFDGTSFIGYPNEINTKQEGQQNNQFYIRFRANQPDGILLVQSGGNTVASDYLLLALDAGHVIFSYNLGQQGPGNLHVIRSEVYVADGQWHTVRVLRNKREGTIQVDEEEPRASLSGLGTQQLDTDGYLWLGGMRNLPAGLPVTVGLQGCVSEVRINGQSLHLVTDKMPDAMTESTAFTFCAEKGGA
ncbi:agrin [Elysia marginata]|uniref:Agrin n=1 Tax=Elysia marginata TaxID=1093978 RepID=A0AAV4EPG8_9GAST|nr:agrin [Elysia marginata]